MALVETILVLLALLGFLAWLAPRLGVPEPVLMVVAGVAVAVIPGVPKLELEPEAIFLLFVPPIIHAAAFFSSWWDLKRNKLTLFMLAFLLVIATLLAVAVVSHAVIPGFTWALALVLGAILSPSDAPAVLAVLRGLNLPRRLETVLEGESLLSDPASVVSYRMAVAAVVTGGFSAGQAVVRLGEVSVGGVAVGLVVGWTMYQLRKRIDHPDVAVLVSFLGPYAAFIPGEWLGNSGVISVLVAAMYQGWKLPKAVDAETRLQSNGAWANLNFILNGFVFILLGMQIPEVINHLHGHSWTALGLQALAVCATVIGVRVAWIFGTFGVMSLTHPDHGPAPGYLAVASWAGMRGVDSLVTALALPLVTAVGAPFPQRDVIIFLSASAIVATLVVQGLTLPALVRWLAIEGDDGEEREVAHARFKASKAALAVLERREPDGDGEKRQLERLRRDYEARLQRYAAQMDGDGDQVGEIEGLYHEVLKELVDAERRTILMLRNEGRISNDAMHRVERELDLRESLLRSDG